MCDCCADGKRMSKTWKLDPKTAYLVKGTCNGVVVDVDKGDRPMPVGGKMVEAREQCPTQ